MGQAKVNLVPRVLSLPRESIFSRTLGGRVPNSCIPLGQTADKRDCTRNHVEGFYSSGGSF